MKIVVQLLSGVWSLRPHGLQHAMLPCPSLSSRVCSNSCPLSRWCHPTISSSVTRFSSCPQSFPASVFSKESALQIRWPKYGSFTFSISPSNEYSELISLCKGNQLSVGKIRELKDSSLSYWKVQPAIAPECALLQLLALLWMPNIPRESPHYVDTGQVLPCLPLYVSEQN